MGKPIIPRTVPPPTVKYHDQEWRKEAERSGKELYYKSCVEPYEIKERQEATEVKRINRRRIRILKAIIFFPFRLPGYVRQLSAYVRKQSFK